MDNIETIINSLSESDTTMCYINSEIMLNKIKKENINEIKFNSSKDFLDFMIKNNNLIYNIEIMITSSDSYDETQKLSLIKKYNIERKEMGNLIFKYPKLRYFIHAFNIIIYNDKILLAQSWFNKHKYKVIFLFSSRKKYVDYLKYLVKSIDIFITDPYKIYRAFGFLKITNKNEINLLEMIKKTAPKIDISIKCFY